MKKQESEKRLSDAGLSEAYFRKLSFSMFKKDGEARSRVADELRPIYKGLTDNKKVGNLLLSGHAGTGKTLMAGAFCHEALKLGLMVKICPVPELILRLRTRIISGIEGDIEHLCAHDVLCLDDMGAEKTTEWVTETLYVIIDKWYRMQKQGLIITTNLSLGDLSLRFGDRLASRIAGMCKVIDFKGCPDGRLQ